MADLQQYFQGNESAPERAGTVGRSGGAGVPRSLLGAALLVDHGTHDHGRAHRHGRSLLARHPGLHLEGAHDGQWPPRASAGRTLQQHHGLVVLLRYAGRADEVAADPESSRRSRHLRASGSRRRQGCGRRGQCGAADLDLRPQRHLDQSRLREALARRDHGHLPLEQARMEEPDHRRGGLRHHRRALPARRANSS